MGKLGESRKMLVSIVTLFGAGVVWTGIWATTHMNSTRKKKRDTSSDIKPSNKLEQQSKTDKCHKEYKTLTAEKQRREEQLEYHTKTCQQKRNALKLSELNFKKLKQKMQEFHEQKEQIHREREVRFDALLRIRALDSAMVPLQAQIESTRREAQVLHGELTQCDNMLAIAKRARGVCKLKLEQFQRKMDSLDKMTKFNLSLVEHTDNVTNIM